MKLKNILLIPLEKSRCKRLKSRLWTQRSLTGLIILALSGIITAVALSAQAQAVSLPNPLKANDLAQLIDDIATWLLTFGLTISTLVIIWSALQFMVSGGNEKRVESARKTIWWAVVGIVVLLLAKGITLVIAGFLGGRAN